MSVSQDREEAAGHGETLRPESAAHSFGSPQKTNIKAAYSDCGPQTERAPSPVPSCISMKSDKSMLQPLGFSIETPKSDPKPQTDKAPSPVPSCISMKSDKSMLQPLGFSSGPPESDPKPLTERAPSPVPSCISMKSDKSMLQPLGFSSGPPESDPNEMRANVRQVQSRCGVCEQVLKDPVITTTCGHSFCRQCISSYWEQPGLPGEQACPQFGKKPRGNMDLKRVKEIYKASLKRRFEKISEVINKQEDEMLLNEIYTELYITEGEREGVNMEHEVLQVELTSTSQTTEDTPINSNDIFKPLTGKEKHRTVMTKGIAGIGKTVTVRKFILDWADGLANEDVDFIFPLPFRELNLVRDEKHSLHRLLLEFYPELKELNESDDYKNLQVVFIFDGLDESQIPLNFQQTVLVSDVKQISTLDVLLMSLIQRTLLPSAFIWITSRPAASSQIPVQYIKQVTEIRGFNDQQKEEYFRKRISDESLSNRIISHIKASRSLHIMCHIPVFCWITATVLKQMLEEDNTKTIPKTLTEMYLHFLLIQITRNNQKNNTNLLATNKEQPMRSQKEIVLKLADLAFKNLENHKVMFYEEDLIECNIDVSKNTVFSGMCTEIFKEESVFHRQKVYCFVHLSIQEFLAALHIIMSYSYQMKTMGTFFSLEKSLKFAVERCVEGRIGHMDLFLRFLLGISLETNQRLLGGLLDHTFSSSESIQETCRYIKELNKEDLSPERCINLFHCLLEMNDQSVLKEIERYLESPNSFGVELSPAHCSALAHILLMSEKLLDVFDLKKYNTSHEGRRRLLPAVRCFKIAQLQGCKLNQTSCETVKRSLKSANSLIHLDLSHNILEDSGVKILSAVISNKLQILRLCDCYLSSESCKTLATVLQSPNSLIELDLSHNDLGDSGIHILSNGLVSPECKLQILRLSGCKVTPEGCRELSSALTLNPSHLRELDLSYNHPGESGLNLLSTRLEDPHYKLAKINTDHCAEIRLRPGVQKYACELTVDPNTAHQNVLLTEENRRIKHVAEKQPYPDHPDRFDMWPQVLCREGLSGRCYWEAECSGPEARIAMTYKSINRKGKNIDSLLGRNTMSWTLYISGVSYFVWHNNVRMDIPAPSSGSRRVGVYLDWPAGTLSFYNVSSDTLTHLHTFHSTFTEPLYAGFFIRPDSPVSLCQIT